MNKELAEYYRIAADGETVDQGRAGGWGVQAIYMSMGKRHDYRDSLQAVNAPVLIVHGETIPTSRRTPAVPTRTRFPTPNIGPLRAPGTSLSTIDPTRLRRSSPSFSVNWSRRL